MEKYSFVKNAKGRIIWNSSVIIPEDKKKLYSVMEEYGMCASTAYNRFFRDGFSLWEMKGIEDTIKEFDVTYMGSLSDYYANLTNKNAFIRFMRSMGMSKGTTLKRFKCNNFKSYEIIGITNITNMIKL